MFKKLLTATLIGVGALTMAMPAYAAHGAMRARLAPTGTANPVEAKAKASYDAAHQTLKGTILVKAHTLAAGEYLFEVDSMNVQTPYGIEPGTGSIICQFTVDSAQHAAGCTATVEYAYGMGEQNFAKVDSPNGGEPLLYGALNR